MFDFFKKDNELKKVNFEDVQNIGNFGILINTLPITEQRCLIGGTLDAKTEEQTINTYLSKNRQIHIIVYGKNANDETIYKKYAQICNLGFKNVYIYVGGLFEWLLLQDIYGIESFKTTSQELDILKFKSRGAISNSLVVV
jgi:hypothetical protein